MSEEAITDSTNRVASDTAVATHSTGSLEVPVSMDRKGGATCYETSRMVNYNSVDVSRVLYIIVY